ncbi:MAG: hypothetical protein U0640_12360 [Phycisphaerales bacterium]
MNARWLYILACAVAVLAVFRLVANFVAVMPRWDYVSATARISSDGGGVETARYTYRGVDYVEVATQSTAYGDIGQHIRQYNATYNDTVWFHPMTPNRPTFGSGLSWSRVLSWLAIPGFAIYVYFLGKWSYADGANDRVRISELFLWGSVSIPGKPHLLRVGIAIQAVASYLIFTKLQDASIKALFLFIMYASVHSLLQVLRLIDKNNNAPPESGASVQSVAT